MNVIIDRFEDLYAVVELDNKEMVNMPLALVPPGAKEGDVLEIIVNPGETEKKKKEIEELMENLWEE
ncbi:MAG TPA: DUF3006 domain-containing protein [Candidatus Eremiobacteraeota bacterium]|nr:MAG: hypothetical protein BWY64_01004 [bacterium ADurb.Bin363]HPZ09966.1 DUF3006 domain-containing protein [Candidatus Eremiobacteraeota bacterium]